MEEDDDFGELYSDVLPPFATSPAKPPPSAIRLQIDPNSVDSGDENNAFAAPNSDFNRIINCSNNSNNSKNEKDGIFMQCEDVVGDNKENKIVGFIGCDGKSGELGLGIRVLEKSESGVLRGLSFGDEDVDVVLEERGDKDDDLVEKDDDLGKMNEIVGNFEGFEGGEGLLMIPGVSDVGGVERGLRGRDDGDLNFDESDSESEDDLQIVLNNDSELGGMGMERMGEGDEDEDGGPLVILAGNDTLGNPPMMENPEWGEEAGTGADGERKELGDATKVNGGVAVHPKAPYGNHAFYHPFHSQFKYVRPGATPVAGPVPPGPVGTIGQVLNHVVGPIPGRGKGDWRPSGIKGGPVMQKGLHPGFGAPAWGSNSTGRGLDFTLPSHKTIFEVDIDSFEDKTWRLPGIDVSDFFNFGLNEEGWREYCKQLEQRRLETTMQSKIRTYESGRPEQDYDPDLPPELAAATATQGISSENITLVAPDPGQDASNRTRPPLPTGRPIQVETNFTDRLPSVDTRQPRIRDSDAIIEITCHCSEDEGSPEIDMVEPEDHQISDEGLTIGDEIQDISDEHTKKERRRGHTMPYSSESSVRRLIGSREGTPQYSGENSPFAEQDRRIKGRTQHRSPGKATNETTREKLSADDENEKSYESIDGKHSRLSLSPESFGAAMEQNVENQLRKGINKLSPESVGADEPARVENSAETEREGLDVEMTSQDEMLRDDNLLNFSGKQKLISKDELSQETDEIEDSGAAISEDNKSGSRNSKGFGKSIEAVDKVSQGGRSSPMDNMKRSIERDDNMIRRKRYTERKDAGERHTSAKGEESYAHKGWEPSYTNRLHAKTEGTERRRESDKSERALHKNNEDLRSRRTRGEDMRIRDHIDEIGSKHLNKVRESERSEKDDYSQLREHLDIGIRRGNPDKVMGSKGNRDDELRRRDKSIDSLNNKRRKEDGTQRREQTEKVVFHGNRDSSSQRKRERDDIFDERKRDHPRIRDDDVYSVRYKEEVLFQRERGERQRDRDEWHRAKHSSEEMLSKREREDVRSEMNIRAAEEKMWSSHSRERDDYRGSDREYYQKDVAQHSQQHKRSNHAETEVLVQNKGLEDIYAHGTQHRSDARRARHERLSTRDDRVVNASDSLRVHERKPKEYPRNVKEHDSGYPNSVPHSGKNQDVRSGLKSDTANLKGKAERGSSENLVHGSHRSSSAKLNEGVTSDDEQHRSHRGRSKLERWTSHKERDFSKNTKSSPSSLQIKEPEAQNSSGPHLGTKVPNEHPKPAEGKQLSAVKEHDDLGTSNADGKSVNNKHLDTVEKLKKRSERFKLPMPSEKEITATKKVEDEPLPPPPPPPPQAEIRPEIEIKPERPARKRRWTSN